MTLKPIHKKPKRRILKPQEFPITETKIYLITEIVDGPLFNDDKEDEEVEGLSWLGYNEWTNIPGRPGYQAVYLRVQFVEEAFGHHLIIHEATHLAIELTKLLGYRWKELTDGKYVELLPELISRLSVIITAEHMGEQADD